MPSAKKSKSHPIVDTSPQTDLDLPPVDSPSESGTQTNKKKSRNAGARDTYTISPDRSPPQPIAIDEPSSPPLRTQSVLSQLPHGFPSTRKSRPLDIREDLTTTEKVSDQHSPSNEAYLEEDLLGKTPPTELLVGVGPGRTPPVEPGFSSRGGFNVRSPPTSPPQRNVRPVSFGNSIPPLPQHHRRPLSAYGSPPAPHLPQQHFYNAQDIDLGISGHPQQAVLEEPRFVKFAKLSDPAGNRKQAILAGFEGRLSISTYSENAIEEVGCLTGLRGSVVDATLLTWTRGPDPMEEYRPMVAITLHGPDNYVDVQANDNLYGVPGAASVYRTRVDVYSIAKQEFITELLQTPSAQTQFPIRGMPPAAPDPVGSLTTSASGNYLSVASGTSGEVFVFGLNQNDKQVSFECIAKLWTTVQPQTKRRDSSHHRGSDAEISPADLGRGVHVKDAPIITMNGRWMAICPASSSSQTSLGAILSPTVVAQRQAGVSSNSPPARPPLNCEVESPDADTFLSKVARGVAQEMVKGAKWLGDQGLQAWQNYWKRDQPATSPPSRPMYSPQAYPSPNTYNQFPPTHADSIQTLKEPEIVSIYDLSALHDSTGKKTGSLTPFATFQPPRGCSYLSFAPSGLSLLTSSRKGDFQYVWDLLQTRYPRTSLAVAAEDKSRNQPRVRQIARYERLSSSTVVDITWESPSAGRFAILTKNKTVHLFDLPPSAFRWPPARTPTKNRPISAPQESSPTTIQDSASSGGFLASAMNIAGRTQPILTNWRGRAPSASSGLAGIGTAGIGLASVTGAKGSKAVAAGLSKSLGAATETVNRLQHSGENRMHLKTIKEPRSGRITLIHRDQKLGICILDEQGTKFYQLRKSPPRDSRTRVGPTVFDARRAISSKFPRNMITDNEGEGIGGVWNPRITVPADSKAQAHPLSFAEIETNAPYQPFHSDRRVNLLVYADGSLEASQLPTASLLFSPRSEQDRMRSRRDDVWVFGEDIPTLKLNLNIAQSPGEERGEDGGSVVYRETTISNAAGTDEVEQIVSTTRRRKQKKIANISTSTAQFGESMGDETGRQEGFFEDDCDVLDFATDRV